jgi:hypothetical protein
MSGKELEGLGRELDRGLIEPRREEIGIFKVINDGHGCYRSDT